MNKNQVTRKIKLAENLINHTDKVENPILYRFNRLYPFSTENTKACFEPFSLEKKKVCTVLSSFDQVLEMFLKGCRQITSFDINPLTEDYAYLKMAAFLSKLEKSEYKNFFCYKDYPRTFIDNPNAFSKDTFEKIKRFLPPESYELWNYLFQKYKSVDIRKDDNLFTFDEEPIRVLEKTLSYFDHENYLYLQEHLQELEFKFMETNFVDLPSILTESYDFIYLSNIIQYAKGIFPNQSLENFKEIILKLIDHLNPNGIIVVGYLYEIENEVLIPIYQKENRDRIFDKENFSYHYFPKIYDLKFNNTSKEHDACLIYTKK